MLGQRLEAMEKASTLPRLDGQDEGETLEAQFEIMTIANSCPDLSILELPPQLMPDARNGLAFANLPVNNKEEDVVDGLFFKNSASMKLPLSFRRSTSLNSLPAEEYKEVPSVVDGSAVSVMQPGNVAKIIGHLEDKGKKDKSSQETSDYLLSSVTGTLHKSISSPSVPQIFGPISSGTSEFRPKNIHQSNHRAPSIQLTFSQNQSSKRSFFRRKHKAKSSSSTSQPSVVARHYKNLNMDFVAHPIVKNGEGAAESTGYIALSNPALGLQDADVEVWVAFMGRDAVASLDDKEIKRQEHIYELILTEKHHCLALALMHHLFVGGMKKEKYGRQANLLFPGLEELCQVHFKFLQRLRERQLKFRDAGKPIDSVADLLIEQFSGENLRQMVRLYGLLFSSLKQSVETFKFMQKDPRFASLVFQWSKEPLLGRKNVPECLLLVAQRITKYPLLFEPLKKTSTDEYEKEQITTVVRASKDLNEKVNERVAERERLVEFGQKLDHKSVVQVGEKLVGRDFLTSTPSRRLLFTGLATAVKVGANASGYGGSGGPGSARNVVCTVLVLTDSLVFAQEFGGRYHFVSPPTLPGIVTLNNLILRENAGQNTSLFLVWNSLGSKTDKPEMIELQVINPPYRDKWIETIREASTKWQEEGDAVSDGDEEFLAEGVEYPDGKTTRALEELLEQDRQIMSLLRSRSKLVESLRVDKPHLWSANLFDGKDDVLNAISNASSEIQRMLHSIDASSANAVNRSASCAGEHVGSGVLTGLPRRADTFGGFDSQQRSSADFGAQSPNNKVLYQMVIQLAEMCGEMFQQMVPQLIPQTNQSQHQLQRRMEDLREAQQRLETEKAEWQREFSTQKEDIEKQLNGLKTKASVLQNEEKDISEQREKLYRKLEALQRQGIRPNLDTVSPVAVNPIVEKIPSVAVPPRRTVSQVNIPAVTPQVSNNNNVKPAKQQIPHFLANSSSLKALQQAGTSPIPGAEAPKPMPRTGFPGGSAKPPPSSSNIPTNQSGGDYTSTNRSSQGKGSRMFSRGASQPVQQLLPYRLSEGLKTSSLPRGVGSRSASSMSHSQSVDQQPFVENNSNNSNKLRNSSSASQVLHHSHSTTGGFAGDSSVSYGFGPATNDRMGSYYRHPSAGDSNRPSNGYVDTNYGPHIIKSSVPIVHRRSGSSPVPMSSVVSSNPSASTNHPREEDYDMTNVLFL